MNRKFNWVIIKQIVTSNWFRIEVYKYTSLYFDLFALAITIEAWFESKLSLMFSFINDKSIENKILALNCKIFKYT